jgi:D-alanyl-D-alanine carboxypeptidase (penicillin-binding protein 5/6)
VTLGEETILNKPLVAMDSIPEGGFFRRIYDAVLVLLEK